MDAVDGFFDRNVQESGAADGPLSGVSFAVKDLIDVAGTPTGCGNPDYLAHAPSAVRHAKAVSLLLAAGATLQGKTITDEVAYSLIGNNHHYGAPLNPRAPGCVTGGSSCGSASVVATGAVDFALGTDTGGSVRIPASFCGLFGLRPTHGRISVTGVVPLVDEFDSVGFFTRDGALLERVGRVLLTDWQEGSADSTRLLLPEEIWSTLEPEVVAAVQPGLQALEAISDELAQAPLNERLSGRCIPGLFDDIYDCFGYVAWDNHRRFVDRINPTFGPQTANRMKRAAAVPYPTYLRARRDCTELRALFQAVLDPAEILVFPTTAFTAPAIDMPEHQLSDIRAAILQMSRMAPILGFPEVSLPLGVVDGKPLGLSLMAQRGHDERLLALARQVTAAAG